MGTFASSLDNLKRQIRHSSECCQLHFALKAFYQASLIPRSPERIIPPTRKSQAITPRHQWLLRLWESAHFQMWIASHQADRIWKVERLERLLQVHEAENERGVELNSGHKLANRFNKKFLV